MPEWLQTIVAVIGVVGTVLGILGITSYINTRMQHKAQKKNDESDKIDTLKHNDYINQLKSIISIEINPLTVTLQEIKDDIILLKKGAQATCRNDLEEMYEKAERDGFCSSDDKMKFEATYQVYHLLGQNGVMDIKRENILKMPETVNCIRNDAKVSEKEGD